MEVGVCRGVWRWRGARLGLAVATPATRPAPGGGEGETAGASKVAPVAFWGKQRSNVILDSSDKTGDAGTSQPL